MITTLAPNAVAVMQPEAQAKQNQTKAKRAKSGLNRRTLKRHLKYLIPQVRLALIREPGARFEQIAGLDDAERLLEPLKHYAEEHFVVLHLDAKHNVAGYQIVSHGTASASLVHPREVFKAAILSNSHSIIVAHNHPAGSRTPSPEDVETTETLINAGKLLNIPVLDHLIVSVNGCFSFREDMPHLW